MGEKIEWILIDGIVSKFYIGAVGLIGDKVAIIVSFFDDKDGNLDGKVSALEWIVFKTSPISLKGQAITSVAMAASNNMEVVLRDPDFKRLASSMFVNFAQGLVIDGIYATYFSGAVRTGVGAAFANPTRYKVVNFVIRKGAEASVKKIYGAAAGR